MALCIYVLLLNSCAHRGSRTGKPLTLIKNIEGYAQPGMLVALMGPSGAGKTTLMDVLARRKTSGKTTGAMHLNGQPPTKLYHRALGYCEQQGVWRAQLL